MKKINFTTKLAKRISKHSERSTSKFETLNLNAMKKIRGGDGEADGGGNVILNPPLK